MTSNVPARQTKACPHCDTLNLSEADVCRTCGNDLDATVGALALDTARQIVCLYVAFANEHQSAAVALWAAHTWVQSWREKPTFDQTPYLHVFSPEKRSGKSRLLEVLTLLVRAPQNMIGASEAAIFRLIEEKAPTLLLDEVDTIFKGGKSDERTEALRGILNAGNRKGATYLRCVTKGKAQEVAEFSVFCPKVLAGIGKIPDTIADRSIPVEMRRRSRSEQVKRFRSRVAERHAERFTENLARWVTSIEDELRTVLDDASATNLPDELSDRQQDAWEPLIAIADLAQGHWPQTARAAAVALSAEVNEEETRGVRLLGDCLIVFAGLNLPKDITTEDLLSGLHGLEESPWANYYGSPLDPRGLARLLKPYGISSDNVVRGKQRPKGYARPDFHDAWSRYLSSPPADPSTPLEKALLALHALLTRSEAQKSSGEDAGSGHVSATTPVAATNSSVLTSTVADVAQVADFPGGTHAEAPPERSETVPQATLGGHTGEPATPPASRLHPCQRCGDNVVADNPADAWCAKHDPSWP